MGGELKERDGQKKKQRKGGIGEMGWGEGGKTEMEAKEVRYVGKLQKGIKFLSEFHTHAQPCDKSKGVVAKWMGRVDTVGASNKTEV